MKYQITWQERRREKLIATPHRQVVEFVLDLKCRQQREVTVHRGGEVVGRTFRGEDGWGWSLDADLPCG